MLTRNPGAVFGGLLAEIFYGFAVAPELNAKHLGLLRKRTNLPGLKRLNRLLQMGRRAGKKSLNLKSGRYAIVVRQPINWVSIKLSGYASENTRFVGIKSLKKYVVLSQVVFERPEDLPGKVRHRTQRIKELKGLLMAAERSLPSHVVILVKRNSNSYRERDQGTGCLSPAGCTGMLLEPNYKPFHSVTLQAPKRIAMVHDWRGDANV